MARKAWIRSLKAFKEVSFAAVGLRFIPDEKGFGGVSVVHEYLPPLSELPDLYHKYTEELVLITVGKLKAVINGRKTRILGPGDILYLPPGCRHQFSTEKAAVESLSLFSPRMRLKKLDVIRCDSGQATSRKRSK